MPREAKRTALHGRQQRLETLRKSRRRRKKSPWICCAQTATLKSLERIQIYDSSILSIIVRFFGWIWANFWSGLWSCDLPVASVGIDAPTMISGHSANKHICCAAVHFAFSFFFLFFFFSLHSPFRQTQTGICMMNCGYANYYALCVCLLCWRGWVVRSRIFRRNV